MFSNFKLPSFLESITSSSDTKSNTCRVSDSHEDNHSMEKFYTEFTLLGQQNRLKTVFTKKVASTFFSIANSDSEDEEEYQNKAEVLYLKKKHLISRFIENDKESYDHVAFKVIFFEQNQEREFKQQVIKHIRFKSNHKKAIFSRNLQVPISFYVEEVNSVCSKHKCVYIVFKRWAMGVVERLNGIILKGITLNESLHRTNFRKDTFEPVKPYSHKESTTNASKNSSMMQKVNSPSQKPYNYDESLVNQLNFDKVRSPSINEINSQWQSKDFFKSIGKELLMLIKCIIRSLEFLKGEKSLPREINLSSFLWQSKIFSEAVVAQGEVDKQVPQFSSQKKILTTLTSRCDINQFLLNESYILANPSIPKQSISELLKQSQSKVASLTQEKGKLLQEILSNFTQYFNQMLSSLYPSPEQLTESSWEPQSLFGSLLFKLGMTVLDIWCSYRKIIDQIIKIENTGGHTRKNAIKMNVKEEIYSNEGSSLKLNWLKIAQFINEIDKVSNPINQSQHTSSNYQNLTILGLFKKVLKLLLSRSVTQRISVSNILSSTEFISVISEKSLYSEPKFSKASSNQTQSSQSQSCQDSFLMKKYSSSMASQNPVQMVEFMPFNPQIMSIQPQNFYQQSPKIINHNIPTYHQRIEPNLSTFKNQILIKQSQPSLNPTQQIFDSRQTYFKIINEEIHVSHTKNAQTDFLNTKSNHFFPAFTPSKYEEQNLFNYSASPSYQPSCSSYSSLHLTNNSNENSKNNTQSSSQYCTPTFVQDTNEKNYGSKGKESPKPQIKLFNEFNSDAQGQHHEGQEKFLEKINQVSSRDSPMYDLQMIPQTQNSKQEQLPVNLPEKSQQKMDFSSQSHEKVTSEVPSANDISNNSKILIEENSQPSQQKITIVQQLSGSKKPETENQTKKDKLSETKIRPKSSSEQFFDPQQPRYVSEQYKGGGRYEGYLKNNKRHGYGRLDYHEGSRYEGDWVDDRMNGYGKLFYSNGNLAYEGQWVQDEFHGTGKVYNDTPTMLDDSFDYTNFNNLEQQWVHYEGQLQHDLKEGHGTIMLENGESFEGEFHNDRINGKGKFVNLEGETIYGKWKDNIMIEEYSN